MPTPLKFPALQKDGPLIALAACMLLFGVALRLYDFDQPSTLKWDEHHYVETARSYLHHKYAYNDHPPLSKLIIAGFMRVLGDGPVAWRLPSLLFGLLNIGLSAALAHYVFRTKRAALLAAAFVAIDGFFIAYSRTALLDGMIVAFSMASMLCVLRGKHTLHAILAGAFAGCALSFKLNGAVFVLASALACALSPRLRRDTPLLLVTAALVFYAQFAFALYNVGREWDLESVIKENRAMVENHLGYTVVHPYSSKWYTWFLPSKPIYLRRETDINGAITALLTLGNPLLWWAGILAVVSAVSRLSDVPALQKAPLGAWVKNAFRWLTNPSQSESARLFWLLVCYVGPILFWVPALRDAYIYHYLPAYAFALPILAGFFARYYHGHRMLALLGLVAVLEVSVLYAPLWAELPLSQAAFEARLPQIWR